MKTTIRHINEPTGSGRHIGYYSPLVIKELFEELRKTGVYDTGSSEVFHDLCYQYADCDGNFICEIMYGEA